ncbi:zinc-dependent alcohol dehydrogenase [Microbacterium ulmi]|uniref:Zinc-binding alcohol dehydrogenase n=1 Tax=Microbacterium ulmi TaxID=179095 RepID=A0A7Y2M2H3_9MICO|nr:zinc-binding alcohol dehydrogenase [Microbacterium ulmi]NII68903.1 threonine dehydrogenase-like Zn-dependent dehydrogenase [Microbacterium ulmi]NNH03888.1 zinc-binding alcohol dehydrogenase [Microbacterium ulmi]
MTRASERATAYWVDGPGRGTLREEELPDPGRDDVLVRTLFTGISRGTESVVLRGGVPASERERMRAPFQSGDFPWPVKYGYLNVGVVEQGPAGLVGRTVFALFPHQSAFVVPARAVTIVPDDVPARRAVLAGAVETAVNVLWDAAPLLGDRVSIVGAGMIGCCVARLARGIPGLDVLLVDVDPSRAGVAQRLGVAFCGPGDAPPGRDLVVDTSASEAGLQHALQTVATDGEVIEASWFGDRPVRLDLGGDFHARRLTIRASQVGAVAQRRRGTRTPSDRLALAIGLLRDPAFDALLTDDSSWRDLPTVMAALADGSSQGLCHTIDWRDA